MAEGNKTFNNYKLYKGAWIGIDELKEYRLSASEKNSLLQKGGWMIRNIYDFDTQTKSSFWFVIKDHFGGLEELTSSARRDIRKSLRIYNIRQITIEELRVIGYPIFASAQGSYKVKCNVFTIEEFESLLNAYQKSGNKEYWGAQNKETGEIVAVALNTIKENSCEYNILKCKPEALRDGSQPYYGLIYEMNHHYLQDRGLKYVNDGARSITNHSNIQPFLMSKFKFRKAYCKMEITYKWWGRIIINILYPFRRCIPIKKISSILDMEAMARGIL